MGYGLRSTWRLATMMKQTGLEGADPRLDGLPRSTRTARAMLFLHRRVDVGAKARILGLHVVLVVLDEPPVLADEVLAEVPARSLLGLGDQGGVHGRDVLALDDDLLEDREGGLVAAGALLDL